MIGLLKRRMPRDGNIAMRIPGIEEEVAFLSRPEAYPDRVFRVETKQTHMSWIFLTETDAWKLKKRVCSEYVDFSTPERRRHNCKKEVRLNRRLAPDVYRGVVPLTVDRQGDLQLGGQGKPVDWLVCMRRLPSDRMLDRVIARRAVSEEDMIDLATVLSAFYKTARPIRITGPQYGSRLAADLQAAGKELIKARYGLPSNFVESVVRSQLEFLEHNPSLFDGRVQAGKIVEGHGDLRPEHICLERPPVIIDCLEFNRNLRILDAASELAFLALECERLGAPEIEEPVFRAYHKETGDRPPHELLTFYKSYHACVRAKVAVWHLKDASVCNRAAWVAKANRYLNIVSDMNVAA
jgi:aminoglycoside phosphotransferase family enzyme